MNSPESSPLGPSGLRVELGASGRGRFKPVWLVALLAFVAVGSVALFAWLPNSSPALSPTPSATLVQSPSTQPKITWSTKAIEIILSPGENASRSLTFTSDQSLQNIVIEPVPALAPFVSVTPNTFANVPANTPQSVQVNFAIAAEATLGTYDGTVHLRLGTQTLPQTLKAVLSVWQVFRNPADPGLGFSFYFPPTLVMRQGFAANEIVLSLPAREGQFPEVSFESFSTANTDAVALEHTLRNSGLSNLEVEEVIVDNIRGKRFSGTSMLGDGSQWNVTRVLVVTTSRIYLISADNADSLLSQILPTILLD